MSVVKLGLVDLGLPFHVLILLLSVFFGAGGAGFFVPTLSVLLARLSCGLQSSGLGERLFGLEPEKVKLSR